MERSTSDSAGAQSPALPKGAPPGSVQVPIAHRAFWTFIPRGRTAAWWAYSFAEGLPFELHDKALKGYNLGALPGLKAAVPSGPIAAFAEIGFPGSPRAALFGAPVADGHEDEPVSGERVFRVQLRGPPRWYDSMITGLIVMFGPGSSRAD